MKKGVIVILVILGILSVTAVASAEPRGDVTLSIKAKR